MSQDVTQWLNEIKALREQLVTLQQERDEAFAESVTWRDRLDAEIQLRKRETRLLREQVATLEAAQHKLNSPATSPSPDASSPTPTVSAPETQREKQANPQEQTSQATRLETTLMALSTVEDLRQFAREVAQERDRLRLALKQERKAHQDTRANLSVALGDAIDLLAHRQSSP